MANTAQRTLAVDAISECSMSPDNGQMPATETGETATASGSELGTGRSFSSDAGTLFTGSANPGNEAQTGVILVPLENLHANPLQPRQHFGEEGLEALACSIAENGLLQPIIVREDSDQAGEFEIVAGERRWRATKRAGLGQIPAIVLNLSDAQALELGLLENVQREDLTALELAKGYQRLMSDFGHSQESLARKLGKSRSHIANTLRLLNLPPRTQEMLQDGRLSAGHGRALLTAERPEALASLVVARGLSVRETEDLVQRRDATHALPEIAKKAPSSEPAVDPVLSALFGHKVTVSYHGQRGMLTIHFNGLEGLSRLVKRLKAALTGRDELRELATNYDLSRPIQWNEKAYGPKPERLSKKPSAHAVSDSPPRATTPIRADQP
ncbi:MAG: ParB/RepB/Spo0J family partition protein [Gemmatimonadetes bacterium]|nr:ParB/RepB/Spo0J family partition protein [Gemmatimonadota bacterium]